MNQNQPDTKRIETELLRHEIAAQQAYYKLKRLRAITKLKVSDHAMLRYMERVQGIDVEGIRQSILSTQVQHLYKLLGNGEFPVRDDSLRVVIENGVVVTVYM